MKRFWKRSGRADLAPAPTRTRSARPTRLAILGNSDVAAWRSGWDMRKGAYPDFDVTFFAAPWPHMRDLIVEDGVLRSGPRNEALQRALVSTSGRPDLQIAVHDAFLIVGELKISVCEIPAGRYSRAVCEQLYEAQNRTSDARFHVDMIKAWTQAPVFVAATPMPAEAVSNPSDPALYAETVTTWQDRLLDRWGATLIGQPLSTLSSAETTAPRFSRGSTRLIAKTKSGEAVAHADTDTRHMNAEFGALCIDDAFPRIGAALLDS